MMVIPEKYYVCDSCSTSLGWIKTTSSNVVVNGVCSWCPPLVVEIVDRWPIINYDKPMNWRDQFAGEEVVFSEVNFPAITAEVNAEGEPTTFWKWIRGLLG